LSFHQVFAVAVFNAPAKAIRRHAHAAAVFDMVAAREIELFVIEPPGRIHMQPPNAVFVVPLAAKELGQYAAHGSAGAVVQVFANHAAAVGQAVAVPRPFEFSNNRDDSQVLAATITVRPFTWYSCRSVLSTYETPVASRWCP
jgi:hypothetical protein